MKLRTRRELVAFCLRKLGSPVIKINVADEQISDRIDEAVSYWQEFHMDMVTHGMWARKVTQEDVDKGYFDMPSNMLSATQCISIGGSVMELQIMLDIMSMPSNVVLHESYIKFKHMAEATNLFSRKPTYDFSRNLDRLYLRTALNTLLGKTVVFSADFMISEEEAHRLYSDITFQRYCTQLIKLQWGQNLKKFSGINMIGGVQFNGDEIYNEALADIEKLEQFIQDTYNPAGMILIG